MESMKKLKKFQGKASNLLLVSVCMNNSAGAVITIALFVCRQAGHDDQGELLYFVTDV
jgi:hypothetical protein